MGRRINFSPETINHIFGLESVNNVLMHLLLAAPDWEEVEGKLCPCGANWVLKPSGEHIGYRSRPWVSFITNRLMPNTNNSIVLLPRVLLLHAICTCLPLDVETIINSNIKASVDDPSARSIFFSSTITALLRHFDGPRRESGQKERPRQAYPNAQLTLMR
uniref:Uncharacterized protein LOC104215666 n=2 Tax=Nicotiana TaxID=4085 RepID=A0A1U7VN73_NICSY|nr:PREDICTED: uncharacterized protein LOC104215666 [Nicotiana sylvestris]XP_016504942.1 PREDICTED: uncharacterized protein LOC107822876 [Nicotiana tabacum]